MAEAKLYYLHRFNGQNYELKEQMKIYENKLKIYIDSSIFRLENEIDIMLWI